MNPAETTRSGSYFATSSTMARSHASRSGKSPTRSTKLGTPARSARASASMPSRSAPPPTTAPPYAGSAQASSRACRFVPVPETSTTSRMDTDVTISRRDVSAAPPGQRQRDERGDEGDLAREHQPNLPGRGSDRGHPPRPCRAGGGGNQESRKRTRTAGSSEDARQYRRRSRLPVAHHAPRGQAAGEQEQDYGEQAHRQGCRPVRQRGQQGQRG